MAHELGLQFRAGIGAADGRLQGTTEELASKLVRPGGWSCKQVLGHLIDSALNNHQRFVRAALSGSYQGPAYEQPGWVDLHGYAHMTWTSVFRHWREQNELLCSVVDRIPEDKLDAPCTVAGANPVTLRFLIEDYLVHLNHHVAQIAAVAPEAEAAHLFLQHSATKMRRMGEYVETCLSMLTEEQIWQRSSVHVNSIGNLVLHLAGNVRQWIGHGVAGQDDIRHRDSEFAAKEGQTAEISALFTKTLADALTTVTALPAERLTERIKPQDRDVSVLEAIYQVVGHLQEHTGQIVFATKQITGRDLALYKPPRP
jgi:uncharacterized damage-inducible protein DinB